MKIYADIKSGNCYKVALLCSLLDIELQWIHINILEGESNTPEFLAKNSNGKIPLLELETGQCLAESNAILNYLAEGSRLLGTNRLQRALILQWQFFEQYSHEPFIAVARYINLYLGLPKERDQEYDELQTGGHKALAIIEKQLNETAYLTGSQLSIADISLYAYTHVAHEGGFELSLYPKIVAWCKRIESEVNYVSMDDFSYKV